MKKNSKKILRIFLFILIVLWAILVFNLSNQNGEESSNLSRKFVELFTKNENTIKIVEPYIRKIAHFGEYAFGGLLFVLLFYTYKWSDRKIITVSILLGIWYASMDEIHQLLVVQRHGSIFDVYIDSLGFSTGVLFMMLILKIIENCLNKKRRKNNLKTK